MKKSYGSIIWKILKEYAIWQPGDPVSLGDYGVIRDGCFERMGNIRDHAGEIEILTRTNLLPQLSLQSKHSVERSPLVRDLVRLSFAFGKTHGVVLSARDIRVNTFLELPKTARLIAGIKGWDRSWYVVTSVRNAGKFFLLITRDQKISMEGPAGKIEELMAGNPEDDASVQLSGALSLKLVGENAPLSVRLHQLKSRGEAFRHLEDRVDENDPWVLAPFIDGIQEE